jgi:hypothetical protein
MYLIVGEKWGYPSIQIDPNRSKSNQIKLGAGFDLIYLFASLIARTVHNVD